MEHACQKCGAAVEEGTPFCPNCGAPQIRVTGLVNRPAPQPLAPPIADEAASSAPPPAPGTSYLPAAPQVRWPEAWRSAGVGGMVLVMALLVPFASLFLLMAAAGALTVASYVKRSQFPVTHASGARIGAAGGLLGWGVLGLVFLLEAALGGGRLLAVLRETMKQQIANNPDPRAQQVLANLNTPGGIVVAVVFGMLLFLVVVLVCTALGGAAGAWLMRRGQSGSDRRN